MNVRKEEEGSVTSKCDDTQMTDGQRMTAMTSYNDDIIANDNQADAAAAAASDRKAPG